MLGSSKKEKIGKTEWVTVAFGGKIFPFISSDRKTDNHAERMQAPEGPGQIPHRLWFWIH